jgi:hypothetical protein
MKRLLLVISALCFINISCKKDKYYDYYKAEVLQGGNHCEKGTWIQLDHEIPLSPSSSAYSAIFNAVNLPETDNIPGKRINVKFTFDQSGTVCPAMWEIHPSIILNDVK